jgi:hypothetical protein
MAFDREFTYGDVSYTSSRMVTEYYVETSVMVPSGRVRQVKVVGFRVTVYADGREPRIVGIARHNGREVFLGYDEPERVLAILRGNGAPHTTV